MIWFVKNICNQSSGFREGMLALSQSTFLQPKRSSSSRLHTTARLIPACVQRIQVGDVCCCCFPWFLIIYSRRKWTNSTVDMERQVQRLWIRLNRLWRNHNRSEHLDIMVLCHRYRLYRRSTPPKSPDDVTTMPSLACRSYSSRVSPHSTFSTFDVRCNAFSGS